jgi:predicted tellurium resistance membrane protein TerC
VNLALFPTRSSAIGVALFADGLHVPIPRGYLYVAIGFSALVQGLNLWRAKKRKAERQAAGA